MGGSILIVGGGIAGLSTAWALARRGRAVTLFEQSPGAGAGSSSRSASMFRTAGPDRLNVTLALRSRSLALEHGLPYVESIGGFYLTDNPLLLDAMLDASAVAGVRRIRVGEFPAFLGNTSKEGVFGPLDGIIPTAELVAALTFQALRAGAKIHSGIKITDLHREGGRVAGLVANGEVMRAETVVDAAGAWGRALATDSDVGVRPHRRHLFVLAGDLPERRIVWDLARGIYVRPGLGHIVACPCDEEPWSDPDDIAYDPAKERDLLEKLRVWAPVLAEREIQGRWTGLRPLTPDHRSIVGEDPLLPGLFRVQGLGGHGMTAGLALGDIAARLLEGETVLEATELAPDRFGPEGVLPRHNAQAKAC